ncbi:MAG: protein translocase subunit SecF [Gemmatimonadales bacterium]
MIRVFDKANYDFLAVRRMAYVASAIVAIPGIVLLLFRGLNESIEFTGGTLIQVRAVAENMNTGSIRDALDGAGIAGAEIQTFGSASEFVIRARLDPDQEASTATTQETGSAVNDALAVAFGAAAFEVDRIEAVGPKVGGELRRKAVLAMLMSFGAVLLYLWFRFEWRFGVAAVLATVHDISVTAAFVSIMNLEVSLVVVAGMLLIVGYSLNDTIITFDRVRENLRKFKREKLYEILNRSVNETLPRTILTSGTTLGATLALLFFGSETIRGFAWVVTFGILIGTFSSVFIASPVLLKIEQLWPGEDVRGARTITAVDQA